MRELKFRVYSFVDKEFIYFDIYDYPQGIAGGVSEPQEYTGLTDKNSTLIYDGDIIKWGNLNYLVEWNHTACKWQGRCPYHHPYHHPITEHFRDLMNGIVIGNEIENEDLLKK